MGDDAVFVFLPGLGMVVSGYQKRRVSVNLGAVETLLEQCLTGERSPDGVNLLWHNVEAALVRSETAAPYFQVLPVALAQN